MTDPLACSIRGLAKEYDGRRVLSDLSFDVQPGAVLALLGENGSGKSTTLAAVAGVLEPTTGEISVGGLLLAPGTDQPEYRRRVAYVPDEPLLFADLTVRQHGSFVAGAWAVADGEPLLMELLTRFGIEDVVDDMPATFSRGMRQKTALALAFLRPATLLLVDEPFAGLDAAGREVFLELLHERVEQGCGALVATHAQARVEHFADAAIALREGEVIAHGRPADVVGAVDPADEP